MATYLLDCEECGIIDRDSDRERLEQRQTAHPHDCEVTLDYREYSSEWSPTGSHTSENDVTPRQAALRSALITGWGQWSNGQKEKAVALFVVQVINVLLMAVAIGFLTFPIVWAASIIDAYEVASTS